MIPGGFRFSKRLAVQGLRAGSWILCGFAVLMGCSQPIDPSRRRSHAPQAANDVGVIVSGATTRQVREFLERNPIAQVRGVHEARGLFEIYGSDLEAIAANFPEARVSQNVFVHQETSTPPPPAARCKPALRRPTARIANSPTSSPLASPLTISSGDTLNLNSSLSHPHANHSSPLRFEWRLDAPEGSTRTREPQNDGVYVFTPDMVGLYTLTLTVRDDRDTCDSESLVVAVTANPPLSNQEAVPPPNLELFPHLFDFEVPPAWRLSRGRGVIIAVLDSGVNYNHPYLRANIHELEGEIAGNGIDDDGNGFVDDRLGYDFANGDGFPFDDRGHGSHVAGLAASPFFGVAPEARILAVKALSAYGGDAASLAAAILYAVDAGARIINISLGKFEEPHPELIAAVNYAETKNVLIVAAAGNGHPGLGLGVDTDLMPNSPSSLPNENILSVAAKDSTNALAPYSNYGRTSVDVVAPGGLEPDELLLSATLPNPKGLLLTGLAGTSMAAPLAAGAGALIWGLDPNLDVRALKRHLLEAGPEIPELKEFTVSGRHLKALAAVRAVAGRPPSCERP